MFSTKSRLFAIHAYIPDDNGTQRQLSQNHYQTLSGHHM